MAVREKKRLGDLLIEAGAITDEQLGSILAEQKKSRKKMGEVIVEMGLLSEDDIVEILARQLHIEVVQADEVEPEQKLLKLIPENIAKKYMLIPVSQDADEIKVAMADPLNLFAIDELTIKLGKEVKPMVAPEYQIQRAISKYYGVASRIHEALRSIGGMKIEEPKADEEDIVVADLSAAPTEMAPVAKLVETVVRQAIEERASDIHIEPDEDKLIVRNRIDGILFTAAEIPKKLQAPVISRIKVISQLDIAETRVPQDGRFKLLHEGAPIEFRVSSFPTIYGENVVIRILRTDATMHKLSDTGLSGSSLDKALKMFKAPFGIIIVTGPTGSGKTTTLYAALNLLNTVDKNIITVEDPVEYRLPGIRQAQVNVKAGLNFANSMRSILRQDPDVVMVGEIRDLETAEIALQAAMTGHMVLTTMHTNDAPTAVVRLNDLGVEQFLISSALVGVVAQRLVRTICKRCRKELPPEEAKKLIPNIGSRKLYQGAGCTECKRSGYTGRMGIFEVLMMDEGMRALMSEGLNANLIKDYARKKQKMMTMREDGIDKMLKGHTTIQEVRRVTADY